MEISIKDHKNIKIITISGNLDGSTSSLAQDKITPYIKEECCLIFDMNKCQMISSAGLRILLMFAKQIKTKSGRAAIAGLNEEVKDVMEMTGFDNIFKDYQTIEKAIDSFL